LAVIFGEDLFLECTLIFFEEKVEILENTFLRTHYTFENTLFLTFEQILRALPNCFALLCPDLAQPPVSIERTTFLILQVVPFFCKNTWLL